VSDPAVDRFRIDYLGSDARLRKKRLNE